MQPRDDLQRAVGKLLAEGRRSLGPHPEPGDLAAYHRGALPPQEEERIQHHLAACRECTGLLLDLQGLSDPACGSAVSQTEMAAAWRVVRNRLREEAAARPGRIGMPGKPGRGSRRATRSPWLHSLAAVLLVAVGLLAFRAARLQQLVDALSQPQVNAPVLDLRPSIRAEAGAAVPEVPSQTRLFTLVINPTASVGPGSYEAEIVDADGRRVWSGRGLQPNSFGSFSLTLSRRTLGAGDYRLRLFSLAGGHRRSIGEYAFRFQAS